MRASSELIAAYAATHFRVTGVPDPFVLQVGQRSAALEALHEAYSVGSSAFLTAWNPRSQPHSDNENRAAQAEMESALTVAGYVLLKGVGEDPSGRWPGEESVLALGIGCAEAEDIGRRYGQNAIVWAGTDAVPELVLLTAGLESTGDQWHGPA